jgi:hypothetical protein
MEWFIMKITKVTEELKQEMQRLLKELPQKFRVNMSLADYKRHMKRYKIKPIEIAKRAGISTFRVYSYLNGRVKIPADFQDVFTKITIEKIEEESAAIGDMFAQAAKELSKIFK